LPDDAIIGMVLRSSVQRETDVLLDVFSLERGRVTILARGAKRSQKRFGGVTSGLVLARFFVSPRSRGDVLIAESADVIQQWSALAHDVACFAHASYVLELVSELLGAQQPEPEVVPLLISFFEYLLHNGASVHALRFMEFQLMVLNGSAPTLTDCARCNESIDDSMLSIVFGAAAGGVHCASCAHFAPGRLHTLTVEAYRYWLEVTGAPDVCGAGHIDRQMRPTDVKAVRDCSVAMITSLIPRPLRTLDFINKMSDAIRRSESSKS
jgi:DNA repair protein RecO (recombination protein O)